MLKKIFKDHLKWINTTKKFGCTQEEAEDIVGNMYCIIGKMLNKGLDISYGDEVNYYYIYMTLRTSFLQLKNKQKKMNNVSLDFTQELAEDEYINFDEANDIVENKLDTLHWYDKKVYNLIQDEHSIRELSNKTGITYHSLYNTLRKVKEQLKEELI
jgi:hypothetical protein